MSLSSKDSRSSNDGPVDRDVFIHDLKNVMTGALGHLSLARKRASRDPRVYQSLSAVENILRGACKMAETALRPQIPRAEEELSVLDVVAVCAGVCVPPDRVTLRLTHGENLPLVLASRSKMQQLFNNLLTNAVSAIETQGVVRIHLERESPDRRKDDPKVLRVTISDNGRGIPPEIRESIFERGFSTREGGSGVGLASARAWLNAIGGEIFLDDGQKDGTTFVVRIPAEEQIDPRTRPTVHRVTGTEERVLVLDDDEMILEVAEELLNQLGRRVVTCRKGEDAVSSYREAKQSGDPFHLVILDLNVPVGMGGVAAGEMIRKFDPEARLFLSSGQEGIVMNQPREHGFSGSLKKPYSLEELSAILQ